MDATGRAAGESGAGVCVRPKQNVWRQVASRAQSSKKQGRCWGGLFVH